MMTTSKTYTHTHTHVQSLSPTTPTDYSEYSLASQFMASSQPDQERPYEGGGAAPFGNFHNYYRFNPAAPRAQSILSAPSVRTLLGLTTTTPTPTPATATTATTTTTTSTTLAPTGSIRTEIGQKRPHPFEPDEHDPETEQIDTTQRQTRTNEQTARKENSHPSSSSSSPPPTAAELISWEATTQVYILDLGCNDGSVSFEIARAVASGNSKVHVNFLGVDIDPHLINRARTSSEKIAHQGCTFRFEVADLSTDLGRDLIRSSLPSGKARFDLVIGLSLTMWIHLRHGDEGLFNFLSTVASLSDLLIVEPQPWKCYRTARERNLRLHGDPALIARWSELKVRLDAPTQILAHVDQRTDLHFVRVLSTSGWKRDLQLFSRHKPTDISSKST